MTEKRFTMALFGSSLLSSYWNGAATYYRGILRGLHGLGGYDITFYEPDAFGRQQHRDIEAPEWTRVEVYSGEDESEVHRALEQARKADLVIKASGVGVYDELLEGAVADLSGATLTAFWDVDAPATLERMRWNPEDAFLERIPRYDLILTYGGGDPVARSYRALGARECHPVYNALDPDTHHPAPADPRFRSDLALLANRLPDREERIDRFFFEAARLSPGCRFVLGGSGWSDRPMPPNVHTLGHVGTEEHNAFNASARLVLNVTREDMARCGYSPPTRVFEAAGAGACLVTDAWEGIELFLEPGKEVLVAASGEEVASVLEDLSEMQAKAIGRAARSRVLAEHTYARRAKQVDLLLAGRRVGSRS